MKLELITEVPAAQTLVTALGEKHPMLNDVRMHVFRGYSLAVLRERGKVLSLNVVRFGVRSKTVNVAVLYTPEAQRGKGYALALLRLVEAEGMKRGCVLLASKAGSEGGLRTFAKRGALFWSVTEKDEVEVSYALPEGKPSTAALSLAQVRKLLNGRPLCYDKKA